MAPSSRRRSPIHYCEARHGANGTHRVAVRERAAWLRRCFRRRLRPILRLGAVELDEAVLPDCAATMNSGMEALRSAARPPILHAPKAG
jgi:hypothetical protein